MGDAVLISVKMTANDRSKCKRLCNIPTKDQKRARELVETINKIQERWAIVAEEDGSGPPLKLSASMVKQLEDMGYFVMQENKIIIDERGIPVTKSETTLLTLEFLDQQN